jgi:hypothetical protein
MLNIDPDCSLCPPLLVFSLKFSFYPSKVNGSTNYWSISDVPTIHCPYCPDEPQRTINTQQPKNHKEPSVVKCLLLEGGLSSVVNILKAEGHQWSINGFIFAFFLMKISQFQLYIWLRMNGKCPSFVFNYDVIQYLDMGVRLFCG